MKKIILLIVIAISIATLANAQCKCGTAANWLSTEMKIGARAVNKFPCGYQFSIKTTEKVVFTNGGYNCIDASATSCKAKYKLVVYKSTGAVLQTISPFNFSSETVQFPAPGSYKVELSANCGGKVCVRCNYFFTVL